MTMFGDGRFGNQQPYTGDFQRRPKPCGKSEAGVPHNYTHPPGLAGSSKRELQHQMVKKALFSDPLHACRIPTHLLRARVQDDVVGEIRAQ